MNHPLYKMLKFELNSRPRIRLWGAIILVAFLIYFIALESQEEGSFKMFSKLSIITWVVIPLIYRESDQKDSMQLYHLIPVSLNIKFIAKLLVSLIIYPLLFTGLILFSTVLSKIIFGQPNLVNPSGSTQHSYATLFVIWIFVHSFYTMTAIYFKKNKMVYGALSLIGLMLLLSFIPVVLLKETPKHFFSLSSGYLGEWTGIGLLLLSVAFYFLSYRLFKRRQL